MIREISGFDKPPEIPLQINISDSTFVNDIFQLENEGDTLFKLKDGQVKYWKLFVENLSPEISSCQGIKKILVKSLKFRRNFREKFFEYDEMSFDWKFCEAKK